MRIEVPNTTTASTTPADKDQSKLKSAAQQFEAILLQELLKPIQSAKGGLDADGDDSDKSTDIMGDYGTEAIANAISKAGGLGIGKRVFQQVQSQREGISERRALKSGNGLIKQADTV